jgi:hypothetical protein
MDITLQHYEKIMGICRDIFLNKMMDYGTAWRILRPLSITDQIYIKAQRVRNIEVKGVQKVDDDVADEFIGIVNYAIIGLIQLELTPADEEMEPETVGKLYNNWFGTAKDLMEKKNHDYGEAWRNMRVSSYTDLILMKLKRIKQIEDKMGKTIVSEGIDANYLDIINYAVFALIKLKVEKDRN